MPDAPKHIKELDLLSDDVQAAKKKNVLDPVTLAKLLFAAHKVGITKTAALKIIESGHPDYRAGALTLIARIKKKKQS